MAKKNIPKPTDKEISEKFEQIFHPEAELIRSVLERTWMRNILYYLGEQWILWFRESGTFGRRFGLNMNVPTPVSNIIRDYVRSMKALTLNKKYVTKVWPNSEESKDKDAARLGEEIIPWLRAANDYASDNIKELIEIWRIMTGNGFCRTFPDSDTGKYVVGPDGKLVIGPKEVGLESLLPFNVVVDILGLTLRQKRYVGLKSLRSKEWVEDTYKIKVTGSEDISTVDYQRQLMVLVSNVSPWKGQGFESAAFDPSREDLVVLKELEWRPTEKYPYGRYQAMVGKDVVINETDLPIPTDEKTGAWDYTITHFPYNYTPGGFWSTSGIDDLISPQNDINEIDQSLAVNRKSFGRPYFVSPSDVSLQRISERGSGILAIKYDGRKAAGSKPLIMEGASYPRQILEERGNKKETIQEASGDPKNVLRGGTPHAGASGVLVDILRETAEQSHAPDVERFYRNWNEVDRKQLVLVQHLFKETRILKIVGEGKQIFVRKFTGSDLRNNFDVRYEPDSGISSTHAGKVRAITELVQYGFFGDLSQRPDMQRELLRRLGLAGFPEQQNIHRERAEWENSKIAAGEVDKIALPKQEMVDPRTGQPILGADGKPFTLFPDTFDPIFRLDYHELHIMAHDQMVHSKEFQSWKEDRQLWLIAHRDMHEAAVKAEGQQMVEEQVAQFAAEQTEGLPAAEQSPEEVAEAMVG